MLRVLHMGHISPICYLKEAAFFHGVQCPYICGIRITVNYGDTRNKFLADESTSAYEFNMVGLVGLMIKCDLHA